MSYTHAGDTAPGQNRVQGSYAFANLDGSSENLHRAGTLAAGCQVRLSSAPP